MAIKEPVGLVKHDDRGGRTLRKKLVKENRKKAWGHCRKPDQGKLGGGMTDQAAITAGVFSAKTTAEIQTIRGDRQAQKKPDQQPSQWNSTHGSALRQREWGSSTRSLFRAHPTPAKSAFDDHGPGRVRAGAGGVVAPR